MTLDALRKLIDESTILEAADRAYWHSQLPTMNEKQLAKLERILTEAAAIELEKHAGEYFRLVREGGTAASVAA